MNILNLACHDRRTRNLVRCSIALRIALAVVDANQNARLVLLVRTRKANRVASLGSAAADVDLRTPGSMSVHTLWRSLAVDLPHIELRAHALARAV
jgi:hypothetical protein